MKVSAGKTANIGDLIVTRRVKALQTFEGFLAPEALVLDFGCGNGGTMFQICDRVRAVDGVDISEENRNKFEKEKRAREAENCRFILKSVEEVELSEKYDRIISFEVLEHVPDDSKAAKILYKLLKPGGQAAISVPNKWWIFETHGARLPLLPWNRVPFFSWLPRKLHEKYAKARIYSKSRIERLLRSAGFSVNQTLYVTAPMDGRV